MKSICDLASRLNVVVLSFSLVLCFAQPLQAQTPCDSLQLSGEASFVRSLNHYESTKSASRYVSATMLPLAAGIPLCLYGAGLASHDRALAQSGVTMFFADAATLLSVAAVKYIVRRERPYNAYPSCISPGTVDDPYSFPSGHAAGSTVMATYLSLRYPKWYVIAPSSAYALYTYYARMNLGVHYPSDILVGALVGAALGYAAYELSDTIAEKLPGLMPSAGIIAPMHGSSIGITIPF